MNTLLEILATILGIVIHMLTFKLLCFTRKRSVTLIIVGGIISFVILIVIFLVFSRHPDFGRIAIVLGSVVLFIALLFAFFAHRIKNTSFILDLCFVFLQMAIGLAILTILGNAIFEISPYLGFDNAYSDTSVIDPLHYTYIATFVIVSVLHPTLASK